MKRKEMLLIISSLFDSLGFVAPYMLRDKRMLQLFCKDEIGWDKIAPDHIMTE